MVALINYTSAANSFAKTINGITFAVISLVSNKQLIQRGQKYTLPYSAQYQTSLRQLTQRALPK